MVGTSNQSFPEMAIEWMLIPIGNLTHPQVVTSCQPGGLMFPDRAKLFVSMVQAVHAVVRMGTGENVRTVRLR